MDDDKEHSILLLDDIDKCVTGLMVDTGMPRVNGVLQSEQRQRHAESRALSTFLGALDSLMDTRLRPRVNIILVCTCTTNINTSLLRFDDVVNLEPPPFEERSKIVAGFIGLSNGSATIPKDEKSLVDDIAASTVGMSYAEISQCCRLAIAEVENESDDTADEQQRSNESLSYSKALRLMQDTLHSMTPASLRSGENDGFVDMRVLSSKDLQAECPGSSKECPLFGSSVETAWRELESLVVFPLCRADALNQLLANIKQPSTSVKLCGGVLLTGGPGSGKSSLARYCAAYAASILPSVKLLEVSCTSLIQKEVGSSERAIRRLFDCARSAAPCIVILDDVAIVSSVRGNDNTTEGTMDRVLSTLLTELDGIDRQASAGIEWAGFAVIGITQNEEWVDPALLRPGRLGKTVRLGSPDKETRRRIAIKELKKNQIANDRATETDIASEVASLAEAIAERTDGLNSASVIAMCNEAKRSIITKYSDSAKLPDPSDILHMMHNHVLALPFRSSNTQ